MNGNVTVSSDGAHGSTFRVHVLMHLSQMLVSPMLRPGGHATSATVLRGKRVLVLARSNANRSLFEQLLPFADASADCLPVERGAPILESATAERLEGADIIVAELSLLPALLQLVQYHAKGLQYRPLMVALTTPLQCVAC